MERRSIDVCNQWYRRPILYVARMGYLIYHSYWGFIMLVQIPDCDSVYLVMRTMGTCEPFHWIWAEKAHLYGIWKNKKYTKMGQQVSAPQPHKKVKFSSSPPSIPEDITNHIATYLSKTDIARRRMGMEWQRRFATGVARWALYPTKIRRDRKCTFIW